MTEGTVIARGGLELRRTPKTGKVVKSLRRSSKVEILGEETWLRVRTRDGLEGFVLADFVERDPGDLCVRGTRAAGNAAAQQAGLDDKSDIRVYRNTRFIGETPRVDAAFFPALDRLNDYAEECDLEIYVTSSTRDPAHGESISVVPPSQRSNHLVGHAIDFNLRSASGFFNSKRLRKRNLKKLPSEIRRFIELVRGDGELRWGGDFDPEDPVHIDDGLNRRRAAVWARKFASRA
jgi:hypothetical protein